MSEKPAKILLVEDNPGDARLMRAYLTADGADSFELEWVDRLEKGMGLLAQSRFDAIVLDLKLPDSCGLDTYRRIRERAAGTPVLVLSGFADASTAIEAVRLGAQDYLIKGEVGGPALVRAIRYAMERERAAAANRAPRADRSRVFGFVGSKGGVGTSTVAVNVASALARNGASVVLAEVRPFPGTLALQLQTAAPGSTAELVDIDLGRLAEYDVSSRLCHLPAGVRVLFGPRQYEQTREQTPAFVEALVRLLKGIAPYVVLDVLAYPPAVARAALHACDFVSIVVEPEPVALRAARTLVELFDNWGINRRMIGLVAVGQKIVGNPMRTSEVRTAAGCELLGVIPPAADALLAAQSAGSPIVIARPDSNCATVLSDLASRLACEPVAFLSI